MLCLCSVNSSIAPQPIPLVWTAQCAAVYRSQYRFVSLTLLPQVCLGRSHGARVLPAPEHHYDARYDEALLAHLMPPEVRRPLRLSGPGF